MMIITIIIIIITIIIISPFIESLPPRRQGNRKLEESNASLTFDGFSACVMHIEILWCSIFCTCLVVLGCNSHNKITHGGVDCRFKKKL